MARDSSATKARLLDAAFSEFATYGIAGARVDRIAEAAQANKRLIYVYFGNKEQLFDAVLQRALETGSESVPFDVEDLPGYAGAIFDHLVAQPALMRLMLWKQLERPGSADAEVASYRAKIALVEQAQRAGLIEPSLDPADVLTLVLGLSQAWFGAMGGDADWEPERLARHRAAVVESVRRATSPAPAP
ncbi:TetR family transcriptional regulator [Streptomyces sp. Mg1]|uniref:TetR family transcriptional regulator n=1 Tax=Streptomyces sp. Mg1 TaxID=465541 RepID=UPI00017E8CA4|nr:TetR family transcriptional regulator [Streptomyces sp. Mg1]AKL69256.1 TetR family transcriptional regulator [Streptomyces sp. Mg1]EDX27083.1 transcriptional regulator [Streptomyces sp. Mg1]